MEHLWKMQEKPGQIEGNPGKNYGKTTENQEHQWKNMEEQRKIHGKTMENLGKPWTI